METDLLLLWLKGFLTGLSVAAPVGPIGILCINRTIQFGRFAGFLSGLGAAAADAVYGSVAVFGLIAITNVLSGWYMFLSLISGGFLLILGMYIIRSKPQFVRTDLRASQLLRIFLSTFFLTLGNPITIISFSAIFISFGIDAFGENLEQRSVLVLGIFSGSALWWFGLSVVVSALKTNLSDRNLLRLNRISGVVILLFGFFAFMNFFQEKSIQTTVSEGITNQAYNPRELSGFTKAVPGVQLSFPKDHGAHPDFLTEWWYYTGNLEDKPGNRYGYQLTFFRRALIPIQEKVERQSDWETTQVYLAHFALTDSNAEEHYAFEKVGRGAAGIAGAVPKPFEVWLDQWEVKMVAENVYNIQAKDQTKDGTEIFVTLELQDIKGPVLQGDQGYSKKGPEEGAGSYYYSMTRFVTNGVLGIGANTYDVSGVSWMDHEFSTSVLSPDQVGWDWFSIHLDDQTELMVFQIRQREGVIDPYSSGSWIGENRSTQTLNKDDFSIEIMDTWVSPNSGGEYPIRWKLDIPDKGLAIEITPLVIDQELNLTYTYWEGAVQFTGTLNREPISGFGYVEMTGYAGSMAGEF